MRVGYQLDEINAEVAAYQQTYFIFLLRHKIIIIIEPMEIVSIIKKNININYSYSLNNYLGNRQLFE